MKKISTIILTLIVSTIITSCGGGSDKSSLNLDQYRVTEPTQPTAGNILSDPYEQVTDAAESMHRALTTTGSDYVPRITTKETTTVQSGTEFHTVGTRYIPTYTIDPKYTTTKTTETESSTTEIPWLWMLTTEADEVTTNP